AGARRGARTAGGAAAPARERCGVRRVLRVAHRRRRRRRIRLPAAGRRCRRHHRARDAALMMAMSPPLQGLRIVEFEGLGPGPLAGQMLADFGAEVTVIARPQAGAVTQALGGGGPPLRRGKRERVLDLKTADGVAQALALVGEADALIEGNRPGVM